jgi:hypothetical protein
MARSVAPFEVVAGPAAQGDVANAQTAIPHPRHEALSGDAGRASPQQVAIDVLDVRDGLGPEPDLKPSHCAAACAVSLGFR